jgi:uncharacterized beta-barrel protein YwiB (DUF1934 family)
MQKVLVTIKSKITDAYGQTENIEFTADGNYAEKNGKYYIIYNEVSDDDKSSITTTLKIESKEKIILTRNGPYPSRLEIEKGERNLCRYGTAMGTFTVGLYTFLVDVSLDKKGGIVRFSYNLDVDSDKVSRNEIEVTVREAE